MIFLSIVFLLNILTINMKLKYIAMEKNTVLKRQRDIRLVASSSEEVERLPIAKIVF